MLTFVTKTFDELSKTELHDLLQLRAEVFVVEQNCPYQDIDGKDPKALHLLGFSANILVAYARLFKPKDYFENASIGRVIIKETFRDKKLGYQLMRQAIAEIENHFKEKTIEISAQEHLKNFYETFGFQQTSESYLEDDIPHIRMLKK
jgi:ElaA protein